MPSFSLTSKQRLALAHPLLRRLMNEAIKHYDFTVLQSQRGRAAQERAFDEGKSKAHFGDSAHNWMPSVALDVAPWPVDWKDTKRFIALSQVILPLARALSIPIRWGGDFNMNERADDRFVDMPHYELHPWRQFAKESKPFPG